MRSLAVVAALCLASLPAPAIAQDALDPVRELYATADYEGALAALRRVKDTPAEAHVVRETDHYRALCLVALNRLPEAEQAIERILQADPLYRLSVEEAPPRVRAAFDRVRRRVVPTVARRLYEAGRDAYQRMSFGEARDLLDRALRIMDDPASAGTSGLADLKMLAAGFRDLTLASLTEASREVSPPTPTPAATSASAAAATTEPVARRQVLPPWPGAAGGPSYDREFIGAIEVEIDASGRVTAAHMAVPIHPSYDVPLLTAARSWLYEPARQAGTPVAAKKRIDIRLRPR